MNSPAFNIGVHRPARRHVRRTIQVHPSVAQRAPRVWPFRNPPLIFDFKKRPWLIRSPPNFTAAHLFHGAGHTITSVLQDLKKKLENLDHPVLTNFLYPTMESRRKAVQNCIRLAIQNQRMLMAFRALKRRWLLKRLQAANEEDLVTCEIPKKPITLICWDQRKKYAFEANTIIRDMCERVLHHSYFFMKFMNPRNPYTNVDLTQAQFFSIMKQLRATGTTHWVTEGLYACHYNMTEFEKKFGYAVRQEIVTRQFNQPTAPQTIDILLDFIEDQHAANELPYDSSIYTWAATNAASNFRMKSWFKRCRQYHVALCTLTDPLVLKKELEKIDDDTKYLCSDPVTLIALRDAKTEPPPPQAEYEELSDWYDLTAIIGLTEIIILEGVELPL